METRSKHQRISRHSIANVDKTHPVSLSNPHLTENIHTTISDLNPLPNIVEGERCVPLELNVERSTYEVRVLSKLLKTRTKPDIITRKESQKFTRNQQKHKWIAEENEKELVYMAIKSNVIPAKFEKFKKTLKTKFRNILAEQIPLRFKYDKMLYRGLRRQKCTPHMKLLGTLYVQEITRRSRNPRKKVTKVQSSRIDQIRKHISKWPLMEHMTTEIITKQVQQNFKTNKTDLYELLNKRGNLIWALQEFFESEQHFKNWYIREIPEAWRNSKPVRDKKIIIEENRPEEAPRFDREDVRSHDTNGRRSPTKVLCYGDMRNPVHEGTISGITDQTGTRGSELFKVNESLIEQHTFQKWLHPERVNLCLYNTDTGRCNFPYTSIYDFERHFEARHQTLLRFQSNCHQDEERGNIPVPCFSLEEGYLITLQECLSAPHPERPLGLHCGIRRSGGFCDAITAGGEARVAHILVFHPDLIPQLASREARILESLTEKNRRLLNKDLDIQMICNQVKYAGAQSVYGTTLVYPEDLDEGIALKSQEGKEVSGGEPSQFTSRCPPRPREVTASCTTFKSMDSNRKSATLGTETMCGGARLIGSTDDSSHPKELDWTHTKVMSPVMGKVRRPQIRFHETGLRGVQTLCTQLPQRDVHRGKDWSAYLGSDPCCTQPDPTSIYRDRWSQRLQIPSLGGQEENLYRAKIFYRCPWYQHVRCTFVTTCRPDVDLHVSLKHRQRESIWRNSRTQPYLRNRYYVELRPEEDGARQYLYSAHENDKDNATWNEALPASAEASTDEIPTISEDLAAKNETNENDSVWDEYRLRPTEERPDYNISQRVQDHQIPYSQDQKIEEMINEVIANPEEAIDDIVRVLEQDNCAVPEITMDILPNLDLSRVGKYQLKRKIKEFAKQILHEKNQENLSDAAVCQIVKVKVVGEMKLPITRYIERFTEDNGGVRPTLLQITMALEKYAAIEKR